MAPAGVSPPVALAHDRVRGWDHDRRRANRGRKLKLLGLPTAPAEQGDPGIQDLQRTLGHALLQQGPLRTAGGTEERSGVRQRGQEQDEGDGQGTAQRHLPAPRD